MTRRLFHPAVWVVSAWVRREREHCCDRVVVDHTHRALDYAGAHFALSETVGTPIVHGESMSRSHLIDRIRHILNPEVPYMRLSRSTVVLAVALLVPPVVLVATYAQKADRPAPGTGQDTGTSYGSNRQLRHSGMSKVAIKPRDPNAPPWQPPPVPAMIPIRVSGVARDETGRAVAGATITLYTMAHKGSKPAGTTVTDAEGRYSIADAMLPVTTSFGGHPLRREITPYAGFILSGLAPGQGIAWSRQQSMYALKEPNPDDIQGRLPLGVAVVLDLTFPRAAALKGKVVDEDGRPVEGAKLQVLDADLLDDAGRETNNRQGYDWRALPGNVGRAITAPTAASRSKGSPTGYASGST